MQIILHDVVLNETPKLQCLEPTELLQTISVRGDNVEEVLVIPLELNCVMSFFQHSNRPKRNLIPVIAMS
jgi:hypothetical protein